MSWLEHIQTKYRYNHWANEKLYTAAAPLSDEQLTAQRDGASYGAIGMDLAHLAGVQLGWCSAVMRQERPPHDVLPETGITAALRDLLDASQAALRSMVDSLTEESLDAVLTIRQGEESWQIVRWQIVEHIANHSAHHRAEIGQVLHTLGASPGDLDFVYFLDEDSGAS